MPNGIFQFLHCNFVYVQEARLEKEYVIIQYSERWPKGNYCSELNRWISMPSYVAFAFPSLNSKGSNVTFPFLSFFFFPTAFLSEQKYKDIHDTI